METFVVRVETIEESEVIQNILFSYDIAWDNSGKHLIKGYAPTYLWVSPNLVKRLIIRYSYEGPLNSVPCCTTKEFLDQKEIILFDALL